MELFDYLMFVVCWIMGAVYGWYARERYAKKTLERFFNHIEEGAQKEIDESVIPIVIERHKESFFVYNKETNEFMGQGRTRRELESNLAKRYPDKKFAAERSNLELLNESV